MEQHETFKPRIWQKNEWMENQAVLFFFLPFLNMLESGLNWKLRPVHSGLKAWFIWSTKVSNANVFQIPHPFLYF